MTPPSVDSAFRAEWELLHELRAQPRLLEIVSQIRGDELHWQTQLRREFPERLVPAAFALCELRRKGAAKFSLAAEMWFDRKGLEQATAEPVARHKAKRFRGDVWDLCCGIGGDSVALTESCRVSAVDLSPVSCLRTEWNAEVYGCSERVTVQCESVDSIDCSGGLVHIDPDRRAGRANRVVRVEDYVPGLDFLQQLTQTVRGGAIKLGPASNFGGKFPDAEIELISLHGECKEATVWFGDLRGDHPWRATVLPAGASLAGHPLDFSVDQSALQRFLFDPDPAVVRAGLVDAAAAQLGLKRLDAEEEYLTGESVVECPFVQAFEVLAELPNNLPEIRNYFRQSAVGQVEIKCRRIPVNADAVRRQLPLPGNDPAVLIFARVLGKARALVCQRAE